MIPSTVLRTVFCTKRGILSTKLSILSHMLSILRTRLSILSHMPSILSTKLGFPQQDRLAGLD